MMDVSTRNYLRDLAKKQLEYAHLPIMAERRRRWLAHNALQETRPMVVMESGGFARDLCPPPRCTGEAGYLEAKLQLAIANHELVDDDQVISPWFNLGFGWDMEIKLFDHEFQEVRATDSHGGSVAHQVIPLLTDLEAEFHKIKPSVFHVNREKTLARQRFAEDIFGDILPVRLVNDRINWMVLPSNLICERILGMENFLLQLMDAPERMKQLFGFVRDDLLRIVRWMESEGLLTLNNDNVVAGAGSFGFSDELPQTPEGRAGRPRLRDLWINMNSQETVNISPAMFEEFVFPSYRDLAAEFGLVYFGCCEPVHSIWDRCIRHLPNLRKVSISPWCDEIIMGEQLRGSRVIYSRKPHPRFLGVGQFDAAAFREHITHTLKCAQGCHLEIIFRDIYTLCGDKGRAGQAMDIVRELIDRLWV